MNVVDLWGLISHWQCTIYVAWGSNLAFTTVKICSVDVYFCKRQNKIQKLKSAEIIFYLFFIIFIFNCNFLRTKNISKKCTVHKNHIHGQRCSTTLLKNVSYKDNQSALIKFIISRFEQQKHEVERRAFEQERESLLASLAQERSQLVADKQRLLQETDQLRR